ncbi:PAS domain-containing protein [Methanosphaerula palustris]|uniref:hypothetical protein n=1 Tax=Methanosphaerula palustris TaxID=475088 RepID=UPI00064FCA83|nr:hypothetical protein [Methanosphaerula palustris]
MKARPSGTGLVKGILWQVRVVPERRNIHHSLRTAEERFLIVAKITQDLIDEHDVATNLICGFGKGEEEHLYPMTRNGWQEGIHPDDREQVKQATIMHLQTGAPFAGGVRAQTVGWSGSRDRRHDHGHQGQGRKRQGGTRPSPRNWSTGSAERTARAAVFRTGSLPLKTGGIR